MASNYQAGTLARRPGQESLLETAGSVESAESDRGVDRLRLLSTTIGVGLVYSWRLDGDLCANRAVGKFNEIREVVHDKL